jgi:hypothetical protein
MSEITYEKAVIMDRRRRLDIRKVTQSKKSFNPEQFIMSVEDYLRDCEDFYKPVTIQGLCGFLGIVRKTLYTLVDSNIEIQSVFETFLSFCESDQVEGGLLGFYKSDMVKFTLKNDHGYVEKQEIESNGNTNIVLVNDLQVTAPKVDPNNFIDGSEFE